MSTLRRWATRGLSIALPVATLVGCDHATKFAAKAALEDRPPTHLLASLLDLRYVENTDVAFNLLRFIPEGLRFPLLLGFGALAVCFLVAILARRSTVGATRVALLLVLG